MNFRSPLFSIPAIVLYAALATADTRAEDPVSDASPVSESVVKHKLTREELKSSRLTHLKNLVGLTPDQEAKAKPVIDKFVDDAIAAKGNKATISDLRAKYDSDIYGILNPDQQKRLLIARREAKAKLKEAREAKAAREGASPSPVPASSN